jgi:uncharacterized protein (TIGR03083 family)
MDCDRATRVVKDQEVSTAVRHARLELADRVESLPPEQWDADSWCTGWRVRDVLGHLVCLAEATRISIWVVVPLRGGGNADRALDRMARRLGDEAVPELAHRLRTAPIRSASLRGLGDVLVHAADALRPIGREFEVRPRQVVPILDVYRGLFGRLAFHAAPAKGKRLVATDADWAHGQGPEISGRAIDLLLLLANRRQVIPLLEGPGTAGL